MLTEKNRNSHQDSSCSSSRWRAKYCQTLLENEGLAKKVAQLVQQLNKVRTRCAHLEQILNKSNQKSHPDQIDCCKKENDICGIGSVARSYNWSASCMQKKIQREEQDFIGEIQRQHSILQRDQKILQSKYKGSIETNKKYKQQIQHLKRRYCSGPLLQQKSTKIGGCNKGVSDIDQYDGDVRNMLGKLQIRLLRSESEMISLKDEYETLKKENNILLSCKYSEMVDHQDSDEEISTVRTELKLLRIQYNTLESKSLAQSKIHRMTLVKLQECNSYMHRLHHELQTLRYEKEKADIEILKTEDEKAQIKELTKQNEFLEERITKLCELPLLHKNSTANISLTQQIIDLENENEEYQNQIQQLQTNRYQDLSNIDSLRCKCDKLEDYCTDLESQLMQSKNLEVKNEKQKVEENNPPRNGIQNLKYIVSELVDKGTQDGSFLQDSMKECDTGQLEFRKSESGDLQQAQDTQGALNDDLKEKLRLSDIREKAIKVQMENRAYDNHILAIQRLHRIRLLEELIICKDSQKSRMRREGILFEMAADENLLQISVHDAEISHSLIGVNDRSVVGLDLLNFEPQITSICIGRQPRFNYTTSFKMKINAFLMQQINSRHLEIEYYYVTSKLNFELKAYASVSLKHLLFSNEGESNHRLCLRHPNSDLDSVFGFINIKAKLAQPLDIQKLVEEWRYDEVHSNALSIQGSPSYNEKLIQLFDIKSQNHLEVKIGKVTNLMKEIKHLYVRYQLLGFVYECTNVVKYESKKGTDLEYTSTLAPIIVNRPMLDALGGGDFELTVYHSNQSYNKNNFAIYGIGKYSLSELVNNPTLKTSIQIISLDGIHVGNIHVQIRWDRHPKLMNIVEFNSDKDGNYVEIILDKFCNGSDIYYIEFLRCVDPPYPVFKIINTMYHLLCSSEEKIGKLEKELGKGCSDVYVTRDQFITVMSELGAPSIHQEEAHDLYCYMDVWNEERLLSDYILFFLFSPEVKQLREKFFSIRGTSISIREHFKIADDGKIGSMSKESCLQCLQSSGIIMGKNR